MKINMLFLLFFSFVIFLQNGCVKKDEYVCSGHDHAGHNHKTGIETDDAIHVHDEGFTEGDFAHNHGGLKKSPEESVHAHDVIKKGIAESEHAHEYNGEWPDLYCEHGIFLFNCEPCSHGMGFVQVDDELQKKGLLEVEPVTYQSFSPEIELRGELEFVPQSFSRLSSRCDGLVYSVSVKIGDKVQQGDRLAVVECAGLAVLQAEFMEGAAERKLAEINLQRQRTIQAGDFISLYELEKAEKELRVFEARLLSVRQRLLQLGMNADEIRGLEDETYQADGRIAVFAPLDGEVLEFELRVGEHVLAEEQRAMVANTEELWLWLNVPESQLDFLNREGLENLEAVFKVPAWSGMEFIAEPDYILPDIDRQTRQAKLRLPVNNQAGKLFPGMYAKAVLRHKEAEYSPSLPLAAILSDEGQEFVFVHFYENYFLRRNLQTGLKNQEFVQVYSGVEPGMMVAARGNFLLKGEIMHDKMGHGCAH